MGCGDWDSSGVDGRREHGDGEAGSFFTGFWT
jgi:hypothetical protein